LYYKLRSRQRFLNSCDETYLGIDEAACQEDPNVASVDGLLVSKLVAPMFVFKLHYAETNVDGNCFWWTMQVAEGPCEGYYLDLNPGNDFDTKFTKVQAHEGL